MRILFTSVFECTVKKSHKQQKADFDVAVRALAADVTIAEFPDGIEIYG
ncbi:Addiction module toxin RelE (fragment) [Denitratisoma oestradiolicum]|uniref:Addiction module toxin RelE n=1 Tax=Denitratisoma oestradiolicum TaxID=311182 RepID=A0A6S6Y3S3_9PROT